MPSAGVHGVRWRDSGAKGPRRRLCRLATLAWALAVLLIGAGAAPAAEPFRTEEVAPGVFVYAAPIALAAPENAGAIANLGFVVGQDAVAVIDTGGSRQAGERLAAAIRQRTALPVRWVINTHVHPDHLFGNAAFVAPGVTFVGHHNLPASLAERGPGYLTANRALVGDAFEGTTIVPPTRLVDGVLELDLGGRSLRLESWPTAHTNTDLTVLDLQTGTWFLGDLLFVQHVPALDGRIKGWIATLRQLRQRSAERAVPGHGPASVPWPSALASVERYLSALEADVRRAVREGGTLRDTADHAGRSEAGAWSLFDDFNRRNATTAFQELEWE
jgi:quinoprotein relay system zinc metallohydrolase 2